MTAGARIIQLREIKDEILRDFPNNDNAAQAAGKLDNANSYLARLALLESSQQSGPADDGAGAPQTESASSNGAPPQTDGDGA